MGTKMLAGAAATGLCLALAATPALAAEEDEERETVYAGHLEELNNSGAWGDALITVAPDGASINVDLIAEELDLDGPHAMHLHGIVDDGEVLSSTCPTAVDDADGDGVLTVVEGAPRYGTVQLSLTTEGDTSPDSGLAVERFPAGTEIDYSRFDIPLPETLQGGVSKLHVVIHGIDENGNGSLDLDQEERSSLTDELPREATAPALCGTLTVVADGPIQTGSGGTSGAASTGLMGVAGLSLAAVAGAGVVTRRLGANG